jgi:TonB family protein
VKACLALAIVAVLVLACGTQPRSARAGDNAAPPKVVNLVQPEYPEPARKAGVEGMVTVEVVVGVTGTVLEGNVIKSSGNDFLDKAALAAARGSTFEPGKMSGRPTEMKVTVPFRFRLDDGQKDKRGQAPGGRFWTGWPGGQVCRGTGGIGKGRGRDEREA